MDDCVVIPKVHVHLADGAVRLVMVLREKERSRKRACCSSDSTYNLISLNIRTPASLWTAVPSNKPRRRFNGTWRSQVSKVGMPRKDAWIQQRKRNGGPRTTSAPYRWLVSSMKYATSVRRAEMWATMESSIAHPHEKLLPKLRRGTRNTRVHERLGPRRESSSPSSHRRRSMPSIQSIATLMVSPGVAAT